MTATLIETIKTLDKAPNYLARINELEQACQKAKAESKHQYDVLQKLIKKTASEFSLTSFCTDLLSKNTALLTDSSSKKINLGDYKTIQNNVPTSVWSQNLTFIRAVREQQRCEQLLKDTKIYQTQLQESLTTLHTRLGQANVSSNVKKSVEALMTYILAQPKNGLPESLITACKETTLLLEGKLSRKHTHPTGSYAGLFSRKKAVPFTALEHYQYELNQLPGAPSSRLYFTGIGIAVVGLLFGGLMGLALLNPLMFLLGPLLGIIKSILFYASVAIVVGGLGLTVASQFKTGLSYTMQTVADAVRQDMVKEIAQKETQKTDPTPAVSP